MLKHNDYILKLKEICGFKELTNVQKQSIIYSSTLKDAVIVSSTGSGKTHAYLFSICQMINTKSNKSQVVICLPTNELLIQTFNICKDLKKVFEDIKILNTTSDKFNKNERPHLILGTPEKIKNIFKQGLIGVSDVKLFILDEADMLFESDFYKEIDYLFSYMKKKPEVLCYSATFSKHLESFVKKNLNKPKILKIKDKVADSNVKHYLLNCKHRTYNEDLLKLLDNINPFICMIFANTTEDVTNTYNHLLENGYKALMIHGDLDKRKRSQTLKLITSRKYTYIVCSDVIARGIDIQEVSHVISLGVPQDRSFYKHRAGRASRYGQIGSCYLIINQDELNEAKILEKDGISFSFKEIKSNKIVQAKNPLIKKQLRSDNIEKEVYKTISNSKKKVKPNYKKKIKQKISEIKRKQRRDFIRSKIKAQKKQMYKKQGLEKKGVII